MEKSKETKNKLGAGVEMNINFKNPIKEEMVDEKFKLFTIEQAASFCGISRNAMYMRYKRGQITPIKKLSHRIYFTRESILEFYSNYMAISLF